MRFFVFAFSRHAEFFLLFLFRIFRNEHTQHPHTQLYRPHVVTLSSRQREINDLAIDSLSRITPQPSPTRRCPPPPTTTSPLRSHSSPKHQCAQSYQHQRKYGYG